MYFSPTPELKQHCPQWLDHIHQANQTIIGYLSQVTVNNVHQLPLPRIDFDVLRSFPIPDNAKEESVAAHAFINKLDIVYLSLQQLSSEITEVSSSSVSKPIVLSWKWQEVAIKLASQMTMKSSYFRHALRGSLSLTTGLILVRLFELDFGFWTLMTSLLVLRPNLSMTWTRLLQRITGTLSGLIVVAALLHFQVSSDILPFIFCIAAVLFFHTTTKQYGWAVFLSPCLCSLVSH